MGVTSTSRTEGAGDAAASDLTLARRILDGDLGEWHAFVDRYSGLIEATLRQRLAGENRETIHDLYVDIIHDVRQRSLSRYNGRSRLSTWLVMHTSARATDYLRSKLGRKRLPRAVAGLSAFDRSVYQYFFVEQLSISTMLPLLNWNSENHTLESVVEAIQRVDHTVAPSMLRRVVDEARSRRNGAESLQQVCFYTEVRERYLRAARLQAPDVQYARREAERVVDAVERFKERLTDEERRVFELRFDYEIPADEIAREMGIPGRRRVYTIADRVVRRLRRFLMDNDIQPDTFTDDR